MRKLKPIVGILIVFILGALTGALTARFYATFESDVRIIAGVKRNGWNSS